MAKLNGSIPVATAVERVERTVENAIDNPDKPLVWAGLGMPRSVLDKVTPSKMYEDGGLKLAVTSEICARGMNVDFPTSKRMVFAYYTEFIEYCMEYRMPPTMSLFSMWCGTTVDGYNKYMKQAAGSDLGDALAECKESLRAFIEVSAMQGEVDKLIYFHQQKGYYDVVEKVEVKHDIDIQTEEMTEAQIDAFIASLPTVEYEEVPEGE